MSHPHASLIAQLGGATELGRKLGGLPANLTGNWLKRGISWPYRTAVAEIATREGVPLPEGFVKTAPAAPSEGAAASDPAHAGRKPGRAA